VCLCVCAYTIIYESAAAAAATAVQTYISDCIILLYLLLLNDRYTFARVVFGPFRYRVCVCVCYIRFISSVSFRRNRLLLFYDCVSITSCIYVYIYMCNMCVCVCKCCPETTPSVVRPNRNCTSVRAQQSASERINSNIRRPVAEMKNVLYLYIYIYIYIYII
jgi:hypothetical protein